MTAALPKTVGTIGAGNMAEALLRGLIRAGLDPGQLIASDPDPARRDHVSRELGVRTTDSNAEVASASEVVVLAVKPTQLAAATAGLPTDPGPLYVSIAAGCTLARLESLLSSSARVVRAMPNTPALVGAGITALAVPDRLDAADAARAEGVLEAIGRVVRLPESQLDAVTGLSGSGPAYVYLFVEALAEAGVREGLAPEVARQLAIATALGASRLLDETGEHPAVLRGRVTSPGGTTIAGLAELEGGGLRATVFEAVRAATRRSRELAEESE